MKKIKGSCLCGAISYEVANGFEKLFLCSCEQCRQITGSAFASNLFVGIELFDWLEGTEEIASYQMPGRDISKAFCRICGSGVPWVNGDGTKMIVPAGSLNEPVNVAERLKIFASEQPNWASDLEHVSAHAHFPKSADEKLFSPDDGTITGSEKS
ncbi:MAG: GFA family protein [Sulfitobacter sp.]